MQPLSHPAVCLHFFTRILHPLPHHTDQDEKK
jgi:hypothetical protein